VSATKFPVRSDVITPSAAVAQLVHDLRAEHAATAPEHRLDEVVGYPADDLSLDNDKWWTPAEFPWSGDNTAGEWCPTR